MNPERTLAYFERRDWPMALLQRCNRFLISIGTPFVIRISVEIGHFLMLKDSANQTLMNAEVLPEVYQSQVDSD